ncbi:MAG: hypothetical protein HQL69_19480 [Magnetococcales bacterium]|nr:hypothetical protein [Magnetococcales bacterium]
MPATKELIGAKAVGKLTGKTFLLEGVGTGKEVTLIPSPGPDGVAAGHKIILAKGTAIEGIAKTGAATVQNPVVVTQGAGGKTIATKAAAPALVQIEGAGKMVGLGKGTTTAIPTIELTGTLQNSAAGGTKVMLTGGEMKVAQAAGTAGAKVAPGAAAVVKGGNGVAMTQGAAGTNAAAAKTLTGANANGGISTIATKAATASKIPAATSGTIWSGKGLSLGLGLGLGAWGPIAILAIATGGYVYYKKRQAQKIWPF